MRLLLLLVAAATAATTATPTPTIPYVAVTHRFRNHTHPFGYTATHVELSPSPYSHDFSRNEFSCNAQGLITRNTALDGVEYDDNPHGDNSYTAQCTTTDLDLRLGDFRADYAFSTTVTRTADDSVEPHLHLYSHQNYPGDIIELRLSDGDECVVVRSNGTPSIPAGSVRIVCDCFSRPATFQSRDDVPDLDLLLRLDGTPSAPEPTTFGSVVFNIVALPPGLSVTGVLETLDIPVVDGPIMRNRRKLGALPATACTASAASTTVSLVLIVAVLGSRWY